MGERKVKASPSMMPAKRGDYVAVESGAWIRIGVVLHVRGGRVREADFGHGATDVVGQRMAVILGCLPSMQEMVGQRFRDWRTATGACRPHRDAGKLDREESERDPEHVAMAMGPNGKAISHATAMRLRREREQSHAAP